MEPTTQPQTQDPVALIQQILAKGTDITDDDIMLLGQAFVFMQMQQQADAMDLSQGQLDYQFGVLGLNEQQLEQQYQEFEFMRDEYFPWYTGDYFDFLKTQEANKVQMSNNQLGISNNELKLSEDEITKSKNYTLASGYQTEQARLGADAAKWQYLVQTGQINQPIPRQVSAPTPVSRGVGAGASAYGY